MAGNGLQTVVKYPGFTQTIHLVRSDGVPLSLSGDSGADPQREDTNLRVRYAEITDYRTNLQCYLKSMHSQQCVEGFTV